MRIVSNLYDFSRSLLPRKGGFRTTVDQLNAILRSIAILLPVMGAPALTAGQGNTPPNVLFIAIDDMNDWTSY